MHATSIVVDASAVVCALLGEAHAEEALTRLASAPTRFAPDLITAEIASALHKRARCGDLTADEAELKRTESQLLPLHIVPIRGLDERALALAFMLDHSVYDCFYLALAIDKGCPVLTCDRHLATVARGAGLREYVALLGEA